MKRQRSLSDLYYHLLGELLWIFDSSRIDEMVCVTAVLAFLIGLFTRLDFVSAMLLLTGVQLIFQGIDVPKAIAAWKSWKERK